MACAHEATRSTALDELLQAPEAVCDLVFERNALQWSNEKVLSATGLQSHGIILAVARLRYVGRLVFRGQLHMWTLLRQEMSWWKLVENDIEWVQTFCPKAQVPSPAHEWTEWFEIVSTSSTKWKALLKRAAARSQAFFQRKCAWEQWHAEILLDVMQTGICPPPPQVEVQSQQNCLQCRRVFESASACAVHAFKQHDRAARARDFVTGVVCEACLKAFSSHVDLINHINRKTACFRKYKARGLQVEREPGANSKRANKDRNDLPEPFMQAKGPQPAWEGHHGAQTVAMRQRVSLEILEHAWSDAMSGQIHTAPITEALRIATKETHLYHNEIVGLSWSESWLQTHEDAPLTVLCAFQLFLANASSSWFLDGRQPVKQMHERAGFSLCTPKGCAISLEWSRTFFQVQGATSMFRHTSRSVDSSIDIIFDSKWGDLSREETFNLFAEALRFRAVQDQSASAECHGGILT